MTRFGAALLMIALVAAPAAAQEPRQDPQARYDEQVTELASVLGGAHYLRILCVGRGDQRWRDFMRGVISREPERGGALTDAFNEGYRREEARYPECDASARNTEAELRAQGLHLADGLRAWNGGSR